MIVIMPEGMIIICIALAVTHIQRCLFLVYVVQQHVWLSFFGDDTACSCVVSVISEAAVDVVFFRVSFFLETVSVVFIFDGFGVVGTSNDVIF